MKASKRGECGELNKANGRPPGGKCMRRTILVTLIVAENLMMFAQADMPKPTYDFSLSRESKIKLAESAAPPEISDKATVYLLERSG
jgi:hypothetical protein